MPEQMRRDIERKRWTDVAAQAALAGLQAWRTDAADGPQRFIVARHDQVQILADLDELERFIEGVRQVAHG